MFREQLGRPSRMLQELRRQQSQFQGSQTSRDEQVSCSHENIRYKETAQTVTVYPAVFDPVDGVILIKQDDQDIDVNPQTGEFFCADCNDPVHLSDELEIVFH